MAEGARVSEQDVDKTVSAGRGTQPPYLYPDYVATRLRAPKKPLIILPGKLSGTRGPAFGHGPVGELDNDLTRQHRGEPLGERIIVTGRVLDGDGRPVKRGLIEIWQANAAGRYTHKNDRHPAPLDPNCRLITQMYFPGDPLFAYDPIFQSVRDPEARRRMISTFDPEPTQPEWALGYRFDIVLEGRRATPLENHR